MDPEKNPAACNRLGMELGALGRFEEAEQSYRRALVLRPDYPEAHNNLANVLYALGRLKEAERHYRRTLELLPGAAAVHNNLAKVLTGLERYAEAEQGFRSALELAPDFPDAHHDFGVLCQRRGRLEEAARHLRRALELNPGFPQAHANLANTLKASGLPEQAETHFRLALEAAPDSAGGHVDLGLLLRDLDRGDDAQACFRRALALDPDHAGARWAMAMAELPVVPASQPAAERGRVKFAAELSALDAWFDAKRSREGWNAVGIPTPFYLAYQEANHRALMGRYGQLCARLLHQWQQAQGLAMLAPAAGTAIRVGIVSAHLAGHSVWNALVKGWLRHLDRKRFELHLFAVGPKHDQQTSLAQSLSAHFESGERSLPQWARAIRGQRLDALIFPEIGMDPMTTKLASLRLAPVQIASWGHPETTGLPTIDYFLSAEGLEPAGAQENYTERLVTLPNLGCCYQPSPVEAADPDLAGMGIDPAVPLLICPGTPFKYAPVHDGVFVEIARRLGRCQLVFFKDAPDGSWRKLHARLERAFTRGGLNFAGYGAFIPWQPQAAFYGLMQRADVFLDTIGFSGFNTAMQAVECALPIVTREGHFTRGRLASGILKRIGLQELVAASEDDYVALAVKLATDAGYRKQIRTRIETARDVLYDDMAPVRALEDFLTNAIKQNVKSEA